MKKREDKKRGAEAPCIVLYRETFNLFPKKTYWESLIRLKNVSLWEKIITVWKERHWNPMAVETMLAYYYRGVVPGYNGPLPEVREVPPTKQEASRILAQIGELTAKIGIIK